jgi:hypothetical protein
MHTLSTRMQIDDFMKLELVGAGVYVIESLKSIGRLLEEDQGGILYIGESKTLKSRVNDFRVSNHQATDFLFQNKTLAQRLFSSQINESNAPTMSSFIGKINIRYIPIPSKSEAQEIEKNMLFAYVLKFGEVPPLNNALPEKHIEQRDKQKINWYGKQLFNA